MTLLIEVEETRRFLKNPEHWTKGAGSGPNDSRCLINAMPGGSAFCEGAQLMDELAEKLYPQRTNGTKNRPAAQFNDHPDTTHAEVLAFLDEVVAEAKRSALR